MMILRSSQLSPFGRKVKIAAAHLGLLDGIRMEPADTMAEADTIRRQNPLGKIPALVLEDGPVLYDSRVILEFLDARAGGGLIIPADATRFEVLTHQALCDGLLDAALLQVYEGRFREAAAHSTRWLDHQAGKVARGLAVLDARADQDGGAEPRVDVGTIAQACLLGYLDLRFAGRWRAEHTRLVGWLDRFAAAVPSFEVTRPPT